MRSPRMRLFSSAIRPLSFPKSPFIAVTLLPTNVPVDPPSDAAARWAALARVVAAGWLKVLANERFRGEGDWFDLLKVGPPTFSACDGCITIRCAVDAGSLALSDGHKSEQPVIRKPHARGKTNFFISLIFRRQLANSLL